jgi:acetyl esterase
MNQTTLLRRLSFLIAILLSSVTTATAQTATPIAPGLHTDVEFARIGDVSLTLDAFVPEGKGPFATCILVHGGGFVRGAKQSYIKPLFEPLSKAGFAWFTINYRLAPKHPWPACADDVATAVRWVRAHAKEYQVDPRRIALIGESAGGHLVSWHGTQARGDTSVAAVVPFYAPHDLELQVKRRQQLGESMTSLLGLKELNDEAWQTLRAASPSSHVHSGIVPYLLIHGDADAQVPYEQSPQFQARMHAAGNVCDLIKVPGGVHGMSPWTKLGSDYQEQMIAWLKTTFDTGRKLSPSERQAQVQAGLQHQEAAVRRIAVHSLAHSDIADALSGATIAALDDSDAEVREWAATVLGPRGKLAEVAVPKLIAQLQNDKEKKCRETAARALGRIGKAVPDNRQAIPALEQAGAHDPDSVTRVVALGALALISPNDSARIEAVSKYLSSDDSLTRMKAAHALGYLGDRSTAAAPSIAKALTLAVDPHERGYLARSLGQIGDRAQLATLLAEFAKEKHEPALGEMRGAIKRLGGTVPAAKP